MQIKFPKHFHMFLGGCLFSRLLFSAILLVLFNIWSVTYICLHKFDVQLSDIFLDKFNTASRRKENSKMLSNCKFLTPLPILCPKNPGSKTTYMNYYSYCLSSSKHAVSPSPEIYINSLMRGS
jgi:hypothetical protein